jgi:hypothetical protein
MTGTELIAEGEHLAKQCVLLTSNGVEQEFAAVWRGPGIVPAPPGPYRHWLTIDCRFLPRGIGPSLGCLSVYTDEESCEGGAAVHGSSQKLERTEDGKPLYAHEARSLPPIDAIFRFGSERVQQWLRKHNWSPEWGHNDNFGDPVPVNEYERAYQSQCPLYSDGTFATLGGWHFPWPDGDWVELLNEQLLVWTVRDSEPWVEVWNTKNGFRVMQRIT